MWIWEKLKGYEQKQQKPFIETVKSSFHTKCPFSNYYCARHMLIVIAMPALCLTNRSYRCEQPHMCPTHSPRFSRISFLSIHEQLRLCISKLLWEANKNLHFSRARSSSCLAFTLPCLVSSSFTNHSMEINWNIAVSPICNRLFIHMWIHFVLSYHFRFFSLLRHIALPGLEGKV